MAYGTHAAQINVCFSDAVGEFSNFGTRVCASDFARKRFYLFGQAWLVIDGQTQSMAKSILGDTGSAQGGLWAGARPRILAVGRDLVASCQAAFFLSAA